jgi:hypothetical protein
MGEGFFWNSSGMLNLAKLTAPIRIWNKVRGPGIYSQQIVVKLENKCAVSVGSDIFCPDGVW